MCPNCLFWCFGKYLKHTFELIANDIELNDSSHARKDRIESDNFVDLIVENKIEHIQIDAT